MDEAVKKVDAGVALRLGGVEVERYGGLGSMDGLALVLFGTGSLRRTRADALDVFDDLGVTQQTAHWLTLWPGTLDAVGVSGALLADAEAAWGDAVCVRSVLGYRGRELIGGWKPVFGCVDVGAWARLLGCVDGGKELEVLVRLVVWRLVLETSHLADQEGAELDLGDAQVTPEDFGDVNARIAGVKGGVASVLRLLAQKVLFAVPASPLNTDDEEPLSTFYTHALHIARSLNAPVDDALSLSKRSTELRVQQWLPRLPPNLSENPQIKAALTDYEARLSLRSLRELIELIGDAIGTAPLGLELSRALKVDHSPGTHTWFVELFCKQNQVFSGGWRGLLWRDPLAAPLLLPDDSSPDTLLSIYQHLHGLPPNPPLDWRPQTAQAAWNLIQANKPSLGFALLRAACDTSSPSQSLSQSLRSLLSTTYGRPPSSLNLSKPSFLLPPPAEDASPNPALDAQNLSRIFHDALLASLLESQAPPNSPDAERLFLTHIQPALRYLERDPSSNPAPLRRPRRRGRASLSTLILFLIVFLALFVLVGWLLLSFFPPR